jgi:hypothetical protein
MGRPFAGPVDGLAVDELHHDEGGARRRGPGIEEACDVRVRQPCQGLPLLRKARQHGSRVQARVQQLDGGAALELAVVARGLPDLAHAAAAQRRHEPPGPEVSARLCRYAPRTRAGAETGKGARRRATLFASRVASLFGSAVQFQMSPSTS